MSRANLLDADMTTVARWLGEGYGWWMQTLAAMLPASVKQMFSVRPEACAWIGEDGGLVVETGSQAQRASPAKSKLAVTLLLPASQCLIREIDLPVMPVGDVRRLVGLDSDRLLPFPPGSCFVDVEVIGTQAGRQKVAVAAIQKTHAMRLVDAAVAFDLVPQALRIEILGGVRFDFWPALRAESGETDNKARPIWWGVVVVLLLVNLGVVVGRDIQATTAMETMVTRHASVAASARALRLRIVQEDRRRVALLAQRASGEPLALIEQLTRVIPQNSWVQQLTLADGRLRLIGYQGEGDDVLARLRAVPRFKSAQPAVSEAAGVEGARSGFDISLALGGTK
jgi:general secretion pathway protein L